jgi:predicted  nucleic acid-binding Zn-ribbon protein
MSLESSGGTKQNGWNEYSKLVLKELETLSDNIDGIKNEIQHVKQEITKMQVREDKVNELKEWKSKIDEVVSPSQLRDAVKKIDELKTFQTKAVTVFAVVQFAMAVFALVIRFLG